MNLLDIEVKMAEIQKEKESLIKRSNNKEKLLSKELTQLINLKQLMLSGINTNKIANAKRFIYIGTAEGWWGKGDTDKMINEAIKDIFTRRFNILNEYFVCENHETLACQYHTYKYEPNPMQGVVALNIRATKAWRSGEIIPNDDDLSDILYYLNHVKPSSELSESVLALSC